MNCNPTQTQAYQLETELQFSVLCFSAVEEMNRVVSEAFLHFFVRTVGHYGSYVKYSNAGGQGVFEKRSFYKAIDSKTTRHYVKKFIQTQMFDLFIQDVEQQQPGPQQGEDKEHIIQLTVMIQIQIPYRTAVRSLCRDVTSVNWLHTALLHLYTALLSQNIKPRISQSVITYQTNHHIQIIACLTNSPKPH